MVTDGRALKEGMWKKVRDLPFSFYWKPGQDYTGVLLIPSEKLFPVSCC